MTNILIADDDVKFRQLIASSLENANFEVFQVGSGEEVMQMIQTEEIAILILDIMMPGMDGLSTCYQIRKEIQFDLIYIIFVSATDKLETLTHGLELGADDFISKPINMLELIARVHKGEKHLANRKLANFDPLTNLFNRHLFDTLLIREVARSKRYKSPLCLCIIDIDHFKQVNDTHGHSVGDEVLVQLANLLISNVRFSDFVSRWGGEEFAILLPNTILDKATELAERICQNIAQHEFGEVGKITVSIGVNIFKEDEIQFFKKADQALYKAKENGRNQVVLSQT